MQNQYTYTKTFYPVKTEINETHFSPSLIFDNQVGWEKITHSDKHVSLLHCIVNYCIKKFYNTEPCIV